VWSIKHWFASHMKQHEPAQHLLVPPLHAAVTLVQVHDVAVRIRKHLVATDSHHCTATDLVCLSAAFAASQQGHAATGQYSVSPSGQSPPCLTPRLA